MFNRPFLSLVLLLIASQVFTTACSERAAPPESQKQIVPQNSSWVGEETTSKQAQVDGCQHFPDKVNESIKSYVDHVRGVEYCRGRILARGDLNSDDIEDIVVAFTIEGACNEYKETSPGTCGNHVEQYFIVFLGRENMAVPVLQIGQDWGRFIDKIVINNGTIEAETMSHGPDDSHAEFSVTGKVKFLLKNDVLVEQKE